MSAQPRFTLAAALAVLAKPNMCELSRQTGFSHRSIVRWSKTGIPLWSADKVAVKLHRHPVNLWPNWFQT
jgi:hypothetical protein